MTHEIEDEDVLENPACPQCGGPGVFIGRLGSQSRFYGDWFRCRNCGWDFSVSSPTEDKR